MRAHGASASQANRTNKNNILRLLCSHERIGRIGVHRIARAAVADAILRRNWSPMPKRVHPPGRWEDALAAAWGSEWTGGFRDISSLLHVVANGVVQQPPATPLGSCMPFNFVIPTRTLATGFCALPPGDRPQLRFGPGAKGNEHGLHRLPSSSLCTFVGGVSELGGTAVPVLLVCVQLSDAKLFMKKRAHARPPRPIAETCAGTWPLPWCQHTCAHSHVCALSSPSFVPCQGGNMFGQYISDVTIEATTVVGHCQLRVGFDWRPRGGQLRMRSVNRVGQRVSR